MAELNELQQYQRHYVNNYNRMIKEKSPGVARIHGDNYVPVYATSKAYLYNAATCWVAAIDVRSETHGKFTVYLRDFFLATTHQPEIPE